MFPAYAGMIPPQPDEAEPDHSVPRIRGDDPATIDATDKASKVFPAYAGMIPRNTRRAPPRPSVPRIRGDDPSHENDFTNDKMCSPHTRG